MKTKTRIEKKMQELKDLLIQCKNLKIKGMISDNEYEKMEDRINYQQHILYWVISNEWEEDDIKISECFDICYNNDDFIHKWSNNSENDMHLEFELETWFDVNEKFDIDININALNTSTWVNLYAFYDPFNDELFINYVIDSPSGKTYESYNPTFDERILIIQMINDWCNDKEHMSAKDIIINTLNNDKKGENYNEISNG